MGYFVVTNVHGPRWDGSRGIREQDGWDEHAAFMDRLVDEGFVILGGPIADSDRAMLVVEADSEQEIETRMDDDPWKPMGVLRIGSIEGWTIWLDGRATGAVTSKVRARSD
jgi:uncharacterized protein YciI